MSKTCAICNLVWEELRPDGQRRWLTVEEDELGNQGDQSAGACVHCAFDWNPRYFSFTSNPWLRINNWVPNNGYLQDQRQINEYAMEEESRGANSRADTTSGSKTLAFIKHRLTRCLRNMKAAVG